MTLRKREVLKLNHEILGLRRGCRPIIFFLGYVVEKKLRLYKKGVSRRKTIPPTSIATAKFAADMMTAVFQP